MPWPELQGLILSHLRHRYTQYEAALVAGEDRDVLRAAIHAAALDGPLGDRTLPPPFKVLSHMAKNRVCAPTKTWD